MNKLMAIVGLSSALCTASGTTIGLDWLYSGTAPAGPPPWIQVGLSSLSPSRVEMSVTAPGLLGSEALDFLTFNLADPFGVTVSQVSGPLAEIALSPDSLKAGPAHGFDGMLDFANAQGSRFLNGDTAVFWVDRLTGISPSDFQVGNLAGPLQQQWAAGHLIALNGGQSAFVGTSHSVPDNGPGIAGLLTLAALVFSPRRRKD